MNKAGFIKLAKATKTQFPIVKPTFTHCEIIGQTGCGKTSSAILPNIAHRIELGHALLIYDFKGSLAPKVKAIAKEYGRLEDIVEIGLPWSNKINLIENLSITQIKNMIGKATGMDMSKDGFWIGSILEIAIPWIKFWRAVERLKKYKENSNISSSDIEIINKVLNLLEPIYHTPSLLNIYKYFNSFKELQKKTKSLDDIKTKIPDIISTILPKLKGKLTLTAYISTILKILTLLEENMEKYRHISSSERSITYMNIIQTLHSALNNIGLQESFHTPQDNINTLLNKKKIVILHIKDFSENALAFLSHSIFEKFNTRFNSQDPVPISVFIDEVQRVLNPEFELPLDIMREAKVDFFIAHQTPSLLINKIGYEQYDSLMANTATKIIYKTGTPLEWLDGQ
jgi:hypothetical protein